MLQLHPVILLSRSLQKSSANRATFYATYAERPSSRHTRETSTARVIAETGSAPRMAATTHAIPKLTSKSMFTKSITRTQRGHTSTVIHMTVGPTTSGTVRLMRSSIGMSSAELDAGGGFDWSLLGYNV
ncbi:uncharacterized protein BDZ99DRAFT_503396 [Mytilinidion resinicola]|uniref:Uncharacterized protein n=1 Tax=Mytilinidion resinicola TaxID=574789 RepID=A0A6A6Y6F8_9PEZI|nr:uncharacterized protein BDZ99DRAFT_503396 [Mytilinidion resinicola]KAF2803387.1 hypothetical protein BDZ99DRAFT_503396 [Mytilinidion resinicola]